MSGRVWNLEKISQSYPIILLDTCALISSRESKGFEMEDNSAVFFKENLDNGKGIYVTSFVFEEYSNSGYSIYRKNLLNAFKLKNRVLQLSGGEKLELNLLFSRYPQVSRIVKQEKVFVQGKTDLDFLFSGVVITEARKQSVALISNDIGIVHARNIILKNECLSPKDLAFFARISFDNFKMMRPFKR